MSALPFENCRCGKLTDVFVAARRDLVMFDFLEAYIARLDAPLAVQVWSSVLGFARDVGLTSSDLSFRSFVYPTLRCAARLRCHSGLNSISLTHFRLQVRIRPRRQSRHHKCLAGPSTSKGAAGKLFFRTLLISGRKTDSSVCTGMLLSPGRHGRHRGRSKVRRQHVSHQGPIFASHYGQVQLHSSSHVPERELPHTLLVTVPPG